MSAILELRRMVFEQTNLTGTAYTPGVIESGVHGIHTRPDLYDFLGATRAEQAEQIACAIIPDHVPQADRHREARRAIFGYLVDFLHQSTFQAGMYTLTGKGVNLARRPYLAPTGLTDFSLRAGGTGETSAVRAAIQNDDPREVGKFRFQEQYRWDTYFQNKFLTLIGARGMAIDQLLNLVDVYQSYGRIPNALTSEFLSHPQPPFEAMAVADIRQSGTDDSAHPTPDWYDQVMRTVEQELLSEWWDYGSGRIHPRQDPLFGGGFYDADAHPYFTRYVSVHYHPLIVGCQDGKDHHRLSAVYGETYLSVQLHSLIWGTLQHLIAYYAERDPSRADAYRVASDHLRAEMNALMWVGDATPEGGAFLNYALIDRAPIRYGDLSAEIFPLFVGLATVDQASAITCNLKCYYEGNIGLASTSNALKNNGPLANTPPGWYDSQLQWEVNAWAPLMMVAVEGLKRPEYAADPSLAEYAVTLQQRWVAWLEHEFAASGTFHEKAPYDSRKQRLDGLYGNLPGFGWTIASYATFLHQLAHTDDGLEALAGIGF